ncbi:hypothetical protein B0H63DRAFT_463333 [Podospora didyma]|uniref:Uncharacterized protein n=1 Tax=Podospora didyma TaxID=330526 RepID=A0AAE0NX81_9PEZI|nr:hypothetical protein B0H63DRAFT_463333 [Podospora didyma]
MCVLLDCIQAYCFGPQGACAPRCCALSTIPQIRSCLNPGTGSGNGGGGGGGGVTAAPPPSNTDCSSMMGLLSSCEKATPSFTQLSPAAQATCLCLDDTGHYDPASDDTFDDVASACYDWARTSNTAWAATVSNGGALGFCTTYAAALAASVTSSAAGLGVSSTASSSRAPGSVSITSSPIPGASESAGGVPSSSTKSSKAPGHLAVTPFSHFAAVVFSVYCMLLV